MKRTPLNRKTPLTSGSPRRKRCPECRVMFAPARSSQAVCGEINCAIAYGKSEKGRAIAGKALAEVGRREIKVRKEALKSRADHLKDAEKAVRDYRRTYELSIGSGCISCGDTQESILSAQGWKTGGAFDAGHFLGKGARPELRLVPSNIWLQCKSCNAGSSKFARKGETVSQAFRTGLIARIGLEAVEALEADHQPRKYTVEELKAITAKYRAKTRELKKGQAA
ncbi:MULTISPECIES: recombination protein NinG [Pseudomonas]|uniref:Recombination protein NinG n=1 Tax=Pseudomonas rhodesiae TaxID=76760 RepID=A0A8I1JHT7_9PSED|nr:MULTISPECIES: recombination protein NinG [Pseudomonas]MBI6605130.1 recombination protein NinG [Pseudomonas sp. S4_EA_1b]MBI6628204.1 recombination protein NinG [Pseudomonas rhodesiae]